MKKSIILVAVVLAIILLIIISVSFYFGGKNKLINLCGKKITANQLLIGEKDVSKALINLINNSNNKDDEYKFICGNISSDIKDGDNIIFQTESGQDNKVFNYPNNSIMITLNRGGETLVYDPKDGSIYSTNVMDGSIRSLLGKIQ